ncbi:MAG: fasciclin domain-containing protein [Elainellaceae cyanobacterium]
MKRLKLGAIAIASSAVFAVVPQGQTAETPMSFEPPTSQADFNPAPALVAEAVLDIVDTAEQYDLNTLTALLLQLGISEDLRGYGRFTVFAPTDRAFETFLAANPQFQGELTAELRSQLAELLSYHVISMAEPITTDNFVSVLGSRSSTQRTLARPDLNLRRRRGDIYANGVEAIEADIEATNGVIHIIDEVLIPPDVSF